MKKKNLQHGATDLSTQIHLQPFNLISVQKHNHLAIRKTLSNHSHFQNLDLYHLAYELYLKQLKQYYVPAVHKTLGILLLLSYVFLKMWGKRICAF